MKVSVERLPLSSVSLDIQADEDEFKRAVDRAFRKINQQVRIPGFRPGKAPRPIVEQRIGRDYIVAEAQRELMDDLFKRAVEQEDLTLVSEPSVDVYQEEPLSFRVEVQIYPDVDLGDYTTLRVEPRDVEVTDAEIDEAVRELQREHSLWVPPAEPRQPRDGDQVVIDLLAYEDEEQFQSPVENATFELGEEGGLFPEIQEALKHLSPGETAEFDISFAEDNERVNPQMRGKTLHYKVTLNDVKERELPELDDDFATTLDYGSMNDLREAERKSLLRAKALEARNEVVNTAIERLTEIASVEIPSSMLDRQVELDIERLTQDLTREGMSFQEFLRFGNKSEEEYRAELRPAADERLRRSLALDAFAKAEGVEVTDADLADEINRLTANMENPDEMRQLYNNAYFARMIVDELANRKLTDRIIELMTEGAGAVTGEAAEVLREMREPARPAEPYARVEPDQETTPADDQAEHDESSPVSAEASLEDASTGETAGDDQHAVSDDRSGDVGAFPVTAEPEPEHEHSAPESAATGEQ